jgi:uncharacterized protein YqhQ
MIHACVDRISSGVMCLNNVWYELSNVLCSPQTHWPSEDKYLFQFSKKGKQFDIQQLKENLLKLIEKSNVDNNQLDHTEQAHVNLLFQCCCFFLLCFHFCQIIFNCLNIVPNSNILQILLNFVLYFLFLLSFFFMSSPWKFIEINWKVKCW